MMRRLALITVLAAAASPLGAQTLLDRTYRIAPQFVSYRFDRENKTISEFALPVSVILPLGERFNVDLATAYASARVSGVPASNGGTTASNVEGLTDTQLRANYTMGNDAVVLTAGFNLPTGNSRVTTAQAVAAGQIGNDFLSFPISNMGTGFAGTGGIAVARPFGEWNIGAGASFRRSVEYSPFKDSSALGQLRFQPGDEYRARFGADRSLGAGRAAVGLTYFAFGRDQAGPTTYGSGDRILGQAAYSTPLGTSELFVAGWDLYRRAGEQANGPAAPENVLNVSVAAGFHPRGVLLEPNVELRNYTSDGKHAGQLALLGVRTRLDVGVISLSPSVAVAKGDIGLDRGGLSGWRASMSARYSR